MNSIYDFLVNDKENVVSSIYKECWMRLINKLPEKYSSHQILHKGNKFRPKLVIWGYFYCNDAEILDLKELIDIAVCVEGLHKATLILDDYIDNDIARYGHQSMHLQYSNEEAVLFSFLLMGQSLDQLTNICCRIDNDKVKKILSTFSNTIIQMSKGALSEFNICLSSDINYLNEIVFLQTSVFMINSFLIGYYYGSKQISNAENLLIDIGDKCGRLYQELNDLEPFYNPTKNKEHKGKINDDLYRNKKNLIVLRINAFYNIKLQNIEELDKYIYKYDFKLYLKNRIDDQFKIILNIVNQLTLLTNNKEWGLGVSKFLTKNIEKKIDDLNLNIY